jgi:hypothetical protein
MKYREAKEVRTEHQRFALVAVPGCDGFWMLCHPAVMADCPDCGAKAERPCTSVRGHAVLTVTQARVVLDVLEGNTVPPSRVSALRQTLKQRQYYRSSPHKRRIERWHALGLSNPSRVKGPTKRDVLQRIKTLQEKLTRALGELEGT